MNGAIEIDGIEDVCAALLESRPAVCVVGVTLGLHAAAEVIERAIDFKTPTRTNRVGGDKDYQALITDLQSRVTIDSDLRGGSAEIGFFKEAWLANILEFGHREVGHGTSKEDRDRRWAGGLRSIVPANPFMRTAAEESTEPAVDAFVAEVNDVLKEFSNGE